MRSKNTFSISFYVKKHRVSQGKVPVYCRLTVNGISRDISIKRSVAISQWKDGKVKGNNEEAKTLKAYLKQVEAKLFEHYRNILANNTLMTAEDIKNA